MAPRVRGPLGLGALPAVHIIAGFLAFALPGLFLWGSWGFIGGRVLTAAVIVAIRRRFIARLVGLDLLAIAARGSYPVIVASLAVLGVRAFVWGRQRTLAMALAELGLFVAVTALVTWRGERALVADLLAQIRAGRAGGAQRAVSTS